MTANQTSVPCGTGGTVGYIVVDHLTGKPIRSQHGRQVLYQHAGFARRFKREHHRNSEIYRCIINPRDESDAVPMGYVIMRDDTPVRAGRSKDATVRLQFSAGRARVAAAKHHPDATVHRVYIG